MPRRMSRSGCSAWSVAPAMATTIGVRSWRASTPVPRSSDGAAGAGRGEERERLGPGGLGRPVRAVAELLGQPRRLDGGRRAEAHQAGEGHPGALHAHGGRPYSAARAIRSCRSARAGRGRPCGRSPPAHPRGEGAGLADEALLLPSVTVPARRRRWWSRRARRRRRASRGSSVIPSGAVMRTVNRPSQSSCVPSPTAMAKRVDVVARHDGGLDRRGALGNGVAVGQAVGGGLAAVGGVVVVVLEAGEADAARRCPARRGLTARLVGQVRAPVGRAVVDGPALAGPSSRGDATAASDERGHGQPDRRPPTPASGDGAARPARRTSVPSGPADQRGGRRPPLGARVEHRPGAAAQDAGSERGMGCTLPCAARTMSSSAAPLP